MANGRPSYSQLELLVEFLEENSGIAKGLLRTIPGKLETKKKWEEFALATNAIGGVQKSGQGWAKYWAERKCALKKKYALIKTVSQRKGASVESLPELSEIDKRLVAILAGQEFVIGASHVFV